MKKLIGIGILGAIIAVVPTGAWAVCGTPDTFGQLPFAGTTSCGGGSCYVQSPGAATAASFNNSAFWALTKGNPNAVDPGGGVDNGIYKADGTNGSQVWLFGPYANGWQVASGWGLGVTDGCPLGTDTMVLGMFDQKADGTTSYASLSTAVRRDTPDPQWDFTTAAQHLVLRELPKPTITSTSKTSPGVIQVSLTWTPFPASGFVANGGTATLANVLTGYRVYKIETAGAAPSDRTLGLWTSVANVAGSGSGSITFTLNCATTAGNAAYLALGLDLDSGWKSAYVGAQTPKINCDPTLSEPNPKFKLIDKKPRGKK